MQTLFHENHYRQRIANGHSCMVRVHTKPAYQMMTPDTETHTHTHTHTHMPSSGKCLRRIAPATIMVDEFVETTLNTNKMQILPSNYGTFDR